MTNLEMDANEDFDAGAVSVDSLEPPKALESPQDTPVVLQKAQPESIPAAQKKQQIRVQAEKSGVLVGTSLDEQFRLATAYFNSRLMPRGLDSPEKVLVALQLCRELGLPAITSVGKIMVVNGTPAIFGDLPLALVYRSGHLEKYTETFEEKDGLPFGSTCTVKRFGQDPLTRSFNILEAKKAELFKNSIWTKYTKRMLQCRARAWALKDAFADVLMGVAILEYDMNSTVDNDGNLEGEGRQIPDIVGQLNQKFLNAKKES